MNQLPTVDRPRRREYSAEFKAGVLEQCRQPGASLAGVALGYGINPNMVHRWMREERQRRELVELQRGASTFIPLQLAASPCVNPDLAKCAQATTAQSAATEDIRVEIQRAGGKVTVTWPVQSASECGAWLREWLR
ncbi:transposase [Rhodoferax sp.]|uniref:IS66-like element accessory protein TnpA n=1 Tax=Rhodoferax sp. TaxID=50421 RepID=UPI0025E18C39|nr:transposase [Rhodoferax sp.]MCM2339803.1 transposase [Rhodoferax sp.]